MSCRCTLMHALQHTSGLHMSAQFMYLLAYQEWGVMSDEQSGGRAFLMFFRFSRAAGRRETCTSWAPGDSSPVEGKSCAGLRSVSLRWPTKRHEKDTKKDQIRTKQIKKRRMCFLSISLAVLIFCWRKRVFGWIFHLLEHFATRTLRCSAFSYRFDFRLLSSLHVGTKCQTWHLTMDDQAVGDHWITGSLITGSGQLVQICDKPSAGA